MAIEPQDHRGRRGSGNSGLPPAALALALAVLALAWFGNLGERKLIRADEGRYAEIAREMVATGDWLTPRLNGYKYFEKPALQHWATAASFSLFGVRDWSARLWPALTGFLAILLVYFAGNRLFAPPVGLYSAAVLSSCFLFVMLGHMLTLDMGVAFFLSASVLALLMAQRDDAALAERRNWMLAAWAAAALAVLSKGLIGIVLPAAAVALYVLVQRDWRLLLRLEGAAGGALFLAIAAPWFIQVSQANPEFFRYFFIYEHFERFLTTAHGRYQPIWYFVPVLLAGLLPWTISLFPALARGWRTSGSGRFQPARFLVVWSAAVFAFFSASSSKMPSYILPIVPALALLIGLYLARNARGVSAVAIAQAIAVAVAGAGAAAWSPNALKFADTALPAELLARYVPWLAWAAIFLFAGSALAAGLWWRQRATLGALALAAGGLAFAQLAVTGHGQLSPAYSAYHIVESARPHLKPDAPFYAVDTFDHSLPFYLGRTVTMVAYKDELAASIGWEPDRFLPDLASFARAWQADGEAFAVFPRGDFESLRRSLGIPMQVIAIDARRVMVKKP
ncbi:MAG: glycosyltransferase family 39 protein [Betaproteobacteria bacterium]|nr:glycosyltransferase family 39 protein [Betaproteobacteria bacterium]